MEASKRPQAESPRLLRIRVSLNGRPLKSYVFDKDVVIVGRDPDCDVVLDNIGVSRHHVQFELSPTGYYVVTDLGSANGTVFNDQPLTRDFIYNNARDVLQVGKFTLWVTREEDRRESPDHPRPLPPIDAKTTVLSAADLEKLERGARQHRMEVAGQAAEPVTPVAASPARRPAPSLWYWLALPAIFALGLAFGAWGYWILTR